MAASTSLRVMRPDGPVPSIDARSTPRSSAILRANGEAKTRVPLRSAREVSGAEVAVAVACCGPLPDGGSASLSADLADRALAFEVALLLPSTAAASSPSPASTAMMVPTATALPSSTASLAMVPSSKDWSSIVALSVSMSAITSPEETASPSLTYHFTTVPCSIVSDKRGMVISIGMGGASERKANSEQRT